MTIKKFFSGPFTARYKATTLLAALVVLFLFSFVPVHALETGVGFGTLTGLGTQDIRVTIMNIVRIILGFVGFLALILVLYAGFLWMTSAGNEEKITTAKALLRNALIGLIIIFSAFSIASFIIAMLTGTLGGNGGQAPDGEIGVCDNCAQLGSGVIETVYPTPNSRDIPRNTSVLVTFKVPMRPETVIDGCSSLPCSGNLATSGITSRPNVRIYDNTQGEDTAYAADQVIASTSDGRTYRFQPDNYLGNGTANVWYAVKLTDNVEKTNGQTAFQGTANYFLWRFEIGTVLDLDPAELSDVFPIPDDATDSYTLAQAVQASGSVTVARRPNTATAASVGAVTATPGAPAVAVSGAYNCATDAVICVTMTASNTATINAKAPGATCTAPNITVAGLSSTASVANGAATIGCGLTVQPASAPASGSQWNFSVTAQKNADTLRIGNKTYSFVAANATGNQINIGTAPAAGSSAAVLLADRGQVAQAIIAKVNGDVTSSVTASASGSAPVIALRAKIAGDNGNSTTITPSGDWATVTQMSGGANPGLRPTTADAPDQPRNAIISFDFNEPVNPDQINSDSVVVEYDADAGAGENWTRVNGIFAGSNQYRSWNFIPENVCVDEAGNQITNSCSDRMYCLPIATPDASPYAATHYRVTIKAGGLKTCATNNDCSDPDFNTCAPVASGSSVNVCQLGSGANTGVALPTAATTPGGIVDGAGNSFNGNRDTYTLGSLTLGRADGPQSQNGRAPYNLNTSATTQNVGDDVVWYFFINKNINLNPPTVGIVGPGVAASGANLATPVESQFTEVLMSSTLKPGSNYGDGQCGCSATNNTCPSGQSCDVTINRCVSDSGDQAFCTEDNQCPNNNICVNKKYVTLVDRATIPVGWWVTKQGIDNGSPKDGYADETKVQLQHTRFLEVTNYGTELGSGIKDVYQNCFLPSRGPATGTTCDPSTGAGCCQTTPSAPYCCNGQALSRTSWESSACFTGY